MPSADSTGPRVLVTGDSWVRGLTRSGSGSVATLFPTACGASETLDLSRISRTVPETVAGHLPEIERFRPELALLSLGGADSLVFPAPWFQRLVDRFAPPEWAGITGLMPPAMLPRDRRQRLRKQVGVFGKTVIKQVMINLFGGYRRVPLDEVVRAGREVLDTLSRLGTVVVVLGCSDVDDLTFPKSRKSIRATNDAIERLTRAYPNALFRDARTMVDKWDDYLDDHVHLTRDGSRKVTDSVVAAMVAAGGCWSAMAGAPQVSTREVSPTGAVA